MLSLSIFNKRDCLLGRSTGIDDVESWCWGNVTSYLRYVLFQPH